MKTVRCAIYTRKSSDEGLEQSFNSLDAQREVCAAYILSQASEGWTALPTIYDDGGISGGTLERPALQRLLGEVAAGRVDIIVVYKVDRLTRSLFDFAKLVELLDKAGTSFVSITQSFNTTTSMGRLTLNMLLSFAQFEREVTAERIRDKLAASKAKGMWMGGVPPLGYAPNGRTLMIVDEHARLIRHLFERYLALGAVRPLEQELLQKRINVPCRTTLGGKPTGGGVFTRGQLYKILSNVTYAGQIGHKDKVYSGLHQPIVAPELFERVQAMLRDNLQGPRTRVRAINASPLAGKIFDSAGEPLIASHATKGKARYRYYISRSLNEGTSTTGLRVPAREIENLVAEQLAGLFADPLELVATASLDVPPDRLRDFDARCQIVQAELGKREPAPLPSLIERVTIGDAGVTITCNSVAIAAAAQVRSLADAPALIEVVSSARITRSGRVVRLVHDNGCAPRQSVDQSLLRLIIKARRWWSLLRKGEINATELAQAEGVTCSYLLRVVRVAFLSPAVLQGVLAGRQRVGTNVELLRFENSVPPSWREQDAMLLPASLKVGTEYRTRR